MKLKRQSGILFIITRTPNFNHLPEKQIEPPQNKLKSQIKSFMYNYIYKGSNLKMISAQGINTEVNQRKKSVI
jgi:hypothetical protein